MEIERERSINIGDIELVVIRHGQKRGLWPFRRALYSVHEKAGDKRREIITAELASAKQVLRAAQKLLNQRLSHLNGDAPVSEAHRE